MKKYFFPILLALALSATSVHAQDRNFLNHLSVGATAGTDAIGIQAAVPLGDHLILRGAYVDGFNIGYSKTFRIDKDGTWNNDKFHIHDDITFKASLKTKDFRALLDLYPFKRAGFHLTVGAYMGLGNGRFLQLENTSPLPIEREDNENKEEGISINGHFVTLDENGCAAVGLHFPKLRPYAGIGFGRPVSPGKRVSMTLDIGACYLDSPTVQLTDYQGEPVVVTSEAVENLDDGWIDKGLSYAKFFPVVNLGIHIRLF
jgi:hypothetical protein